jgi:hypothetical protein
MWKLDKQLLVVSQMPVFSEISDSELVNNEYDEEE